MAEIDEADLAWLAGVIEGDGCFTHSGHSSRHLRLQIQMNDLDVLERVLEIAGVGSISGPNFHYTGDVATPHWYWRTGRHADVVPLTVALYPRMGLRRQARILEIFELCGYEEIALLGTELADG